MGLIIMLWDRLMGGKRDKVNARVSRHNVEVGKEDELNTVPTRTCEISQESDGLLESMMNDAYVAGSNQDNEVGNEEYIGSEVYNRDEKIEDNILSSESLQTEKRFVEDDDIVSQMMNGSHTLGHIQENRPEVTPEDIITGGVREGYMSTSERMRDMDEITRLCLNSLVQNVDKEDAFLHIGRNYTFTEVHKLMVLDQLIPSLSYEPTRDDVKRALLSPLLDADTLATLWALKDITITDSYSRLSTDESSMHDSIVNNHDVGPGLHKNVVALRTKTTQMLPDDERGRLSDLVKYSSSKDDLRFVLALSALMRDYNPEQEMSSSLLTEAIASRKNMFDGLNVADDVGLEQAYLLAAYKNFNLQDFQRARKTLDTFLAFKPNDLSAQCLMVDVIERIDGGEAALEYSHKLSSRNMDTSDVPEGVVVKNALLQVAYGNKKHGVEALLSYSGEDAKMVGDALDKVFSDPKTLDEDLLHDALRYFSKKISRPVIDSVERAELSFKLGQCNMRLGNAEQAKSDFQKSYSLDKTKLAAVDELVRLYITDKDFASAEDYLSTVPADSNDESIKLRLAEVYLLQNKYESAYETLVNLLDKEFKRSGDEDDKQLVFSMLSDSLLGVIRSGENDRLDEGIDVADQALVLGCDRLHMLSVKGDMLYFGDRVGASINVFKAALEIAPTDTKLMFRLGRSYYSLQQESLAIDTFRSILRDDTLDDGLRDQTLCLLGLSYHNDDKYEPALENLTKLVTDGLEVSIDVKAEERNILFSIADSYLNTEQYKEAIRYLQRLGEVDASLENVSIDEDLTHKKQLGIAYFFDKQYNAASDILRSVVNASDDPEVHLYLALSYKEDGELSLAEKHLDDCLDEFEDNPQLAARAYRALGEMQYAKDNIVACKDALRVSLEFDETNADTYMLLSEAVMSERDYEQALEICNSGLGFNEHDVGLLSKKKELLRRTGDSEEVIRVLEMLYQSSGDESYLLEKIERNTGLERFEEAEADLRRVGAAESLR